MDPGGATGAGESRAAQAVKGYTDTKNRLTGQPRNRIYALKLTPGHRLKLCQAVAA